MTARSISSGTSAIVGNALRPKSTVARFGLTGKTRRERRRQTLHQSAADAAWRFGRTDHGDRARREHGREICFPPDCVLWRGGTRFSLTVRSARRAPTIHRARNSARCRRERLAENRHSMLPFRFASHRQAIDSRKSRAKLVSQDRRGACRAIAITTAPFSCAAFLHGARMFNLFGEFAGKGLVSCRRLTIRILSRVPRAR